MWRRIAWPLRVQRLSRWHLSFAKVRQSLQAPQHGRIRATCGPRWVKFGRNLTESNQSRPKDGRNTANVLKCQPMRFRLQIWRRGRFGGEAEAKLERDPIHRLYRRNSSGERPAASPTFKPATPTLVASKGCSASDPNFLAEVGEDLLQDRTAFPRPATGTSHGDTLSPACSQRHTKTYLANSGRTWSNWPSSTEIVRACPNKANTTRNRSKPPQI